MKSLADLGERAAIRRIAKILSKGKNHVYIGDDCATVDIGKNYLLVTTDMMSKQTHIPQKMTPYQIGWFLVAMNLSDIAAKGGVPLGVLCSFGLPKKTTEMFLRELTKGANTCAVDYETTILGGDTKETREITLCGTAFGIVKKDEFMARTGAHPGDIVAVTGTLGTAGVGFYALKHQIQEKTLSKMMLEPKPKLKEGRLLAQQKSVTSSMDLSDGLSASLYQLQEMNAVGFEIKKDAIPFSSELRKLSSKKHHVDPYFIALHFGGDYELLVTIQKNRFEKTKKILKEHDIQLTGIGSVTKKKGVILLEQGNKLLLENKGYEHFKVHRF